VLLSIKVLKII